jgi:hypothetical protein
MDSRPPPPDDRAPSQGSADVERSDANAEESDERLEATLRAEGLLPVPLPLFGHVLARVRAEPPTSWERAARGEVDSQGRAVRAGLELPRWARAAAAAALVAVGAWLAVAGVEPTAAAAATVGPALADSTPFALAAAPRALADASVVARSPAALADDARVALGSATSSVPGGSATLLLGGAATLLAGAWLAARRPSRPARGEAGASA